MTATQIIRIPCTDAGADPLVLRYAATHGETCAVRVLVYAWIPVGFVAALGGGYLGSQLAGTPESLPGAYDQLVQMAHQLAGNPWATLGGMAVAAAVMSLIGLLLKPRGIPVTHESWFGAGIAALLYLLLFDPLACLGVVTGLICLVYALAIGFRLLALSLGGRPSPRAATLSADAEWPIYTILVPLYREPEVASSILASLQRLDYPREKLDVKLLLEADDQETLPALERAGIPEWIEVIIAPPAQPKTKPRACNHGLERARGEFLVVFDAEDRPDPGQLKLAVAMFRASAADITCLQAQLAYHNHDQNLLTRWFALEYNVWFRRYLSGLERLRVPIPLGGTSNHFRTDALRQLGGWDPFNVTEDCDLGVRLHVAGQRTRMLDSITWEEANSRVGNWMRQRSRWLKGYLITHLVWWRRPLVLIAKLGPWGALGFTLSVFCVAALSALNLVLWISSSIYVALLSCDIARGYQLWELLSTRHPVAIDPLTSERWSWQIIFTGPHEHHVLGTLSVIFFVAAACLLLGNLAFIFTTALCGRRPGQGGLLWPALLSPLYWILISLAAWKAVWEMVVKPHYWQKTVHGLSTTK